MMAKRKSDRDPFAEREAAKYDHPVPSREFILALLEREAVPMSHKEIAKAMEVRGERDTEALRRRLKAMERDGQVIRNRRGGYGLVQKMDLVRGRVVGHPDGFGFLIPDEGGGDLFLSAREMRACMHGDRIVAHVSGIDKRGRREGEMVEVLERANQQVVGRLVLEAGVGFVDPDNKRITQQVLVPGEQLYGAKHGQIVVVEMLEPPTRHRQAIGRVVEILGEHMAPGMEVDIAVRAFSLPLVWSPLVETEIEGLTDVVPEAAKSGREDLRALPLVTIDGEDARDFDDAVYCERQGRGWRLLVAIADVSHYVKPATALDAEARERGNSVYFPGQVIPMLPEILSNGLCSLNPQVDRLCMVCELHVGANGELRDYRFFEGLMRSHARLTYTKVAAMLVDGEPALREQYTELVPHLENLHGLYEALHKARVKRGAIDFDTTETKIVFGEERKIEQIVPVARNDAHRLIEECMLLANVATADYLLKAEIPTLFRIHEGPSSDKLTDLHAFLAELGLSLGGGDKPQPRHYAELLDSVRERPDAHLIQTVMLRSLSQAMYSPNNIGHFGLAYDAYAHFTSPIRRYPDLLVHRAIRHLLAGKSPERFGYSEDDMVALGEHCSLTDRRADEATRDATDWLKCEYMLDKVGEEFEGLVTAVTSFGLFVELKDIYVEGLVHVTALSNDYYHFDPVKHRLLGERTNRMYRLADPLRVRVVRVDLDDRKIDFELAESEQAPAGGESKRGPGKRRGKRKTQATGGEQETGQGEKRPARSPRRRRRSGGRKKE
ncbi:MAG TPA: ribonuclease R [Gammaproteobacteria bacterium]|nr:ribonuclease R [Gammaproteobacteria bacterium]